MSFDEHRFLRLSLAGMGPEEIARELGVPVEEVQAFAERLELDTSVSSLFSRQLREWAAEGFIQHGWSVRQSAGDGSYRMKFRVGEDEYDFTEAQMEVFVLGAESMRRHKESK